MTRTGTGQGDEDNRDQDRMTQWGQQGPGQDDMTRMTEMGRTRTRSTQPGQERDNIYDKDDVEGKVDTPMYFPILR